MDSPHEMQQLNILGRIIENVEKLNEAILILNKKLKDIQVDNMNVEMVAQMFENYRSGVAFHLEATKQLKDPID